MDTEQRDRLLASMSRTCQRIYEAMQASGVPMSAPDLRGPTGRVDGMTPDFRRLQQAGLIESVGKKKVDGKWDTKFYRLVPLQRAEQASEQFNSRKPRRKKRHIPANRLHDVRQQAKGDYGAWYRGRARLIELIGLVVGMDQMAYWDDAPDDDRGMALEEMLELSDWLDQAIEAFRSREGDEQVRSKIAKLRETNGRTGPEIETAHRLADRLEAKLEGRFAVV